MMRRSIFIWLLSSAVVSGQIQQSATSQATASPASPTAPGTDPKALASVEGRTLGADGTPLRKSTVTLRPVSNQFGVMPQSYISTSDAEGKFIFQGIDPGRYTLQGQHAGYIQSSYGARKSGGSGTMLTLTPGQHVRGIDFTLTLQAIISGKVLDDEGDPVSGGQVQLLRRTYTPGGKRQLFPTGSAQTDDDGTFKISRVAPGRYYLSASPPRLNTFEGSRRADRVDPSRPEEDLITTYYPGVTDLGSATTIELIAGRNVPGTDIRLRKSPVFRVKGKLAGSLAVDSGQRVRVMLSERNSFMFMFNGPGAALVDKDGTFDLHGIAPGSYSLTATNTQGMVKTLARQSLEVGNRNIDDVTFVVQPAGTLRGAVQVEKTPAADPSQTPPDLTAVRINLTATAGPTMGMLPVVVKPDGTFQIDEVAADKYRFAIYATPDGTYLKSARVGSQDVLAADLDLTSGAGGATVDVVLGVGGGQIGGTVQNGHQQPAPGTSVSLLPDPLDADRSYLYKNATTDQNGQFTLKNIAPGKYRLYAWEDIEAGSIYDQDEMKPLESLGTQITVEEHGSYTQALILISVVQMEQAKTK